MTAIKFSISIKGGQKEATAKANALATLGNFLDVKTLQALAHVVQHEPDKVKLAKGFLGI